MRAKTISFMAAIALLDCTASSPRPTVSQRTPSDPPEWMQAGTGIFHDPHAFRGVGVARGIKSERLRVSTAAASARAELVKVMDEYLTAVFKRYYMPSETQIAADEAIRRKCFDARYALLQDVQPAATWTAPDGSTMAVLYEVPVDQLKTAVLNAVTADEAKRADLSRRLGVRSEDEQEATKPQAQ